MTTNRGPEENLSALGLALPQAPSPGGNYVPAKRAGDVLYLSGVVSADANGIITGLAGVDRSIEDGYAAGSLDRVAEVLTLNGYVNAATGFHDAPAVINGASDLLVKVFGEAGRHVRAAIGVNALPRNALVEVQMTVRVREP